MTILLTLLGLGLLALGGDFVVRGAVRLARHLGVSPLLTGIAIVGFATSLPELAVCVDAASSGAPALAVANVIGSNISNTILILGLVAIICPVPVCANSLRLDSSAHLLAGLFLVGIGFAFGRIDWWMGALMVMGLALYIFLVIRRDAAIDNIDQLYLDDRNDRPEKSLTRALFHLVAGLVAVLVGAEFLVTGAVGLAEQFGVSKEVIGLTITAVGTSLPEIATTLAAALRGNTQLCLGNIIGSNIFNLTGIAGVTALVAPLPLTRRIIEVDLPLLVATTLLLTLILLAGRTLRRSAGIVLTASYISYVAIQFAVPY
ncbi:MAG: calcium/sodium antiporter [Rhodobacteraceae bacterium]|nr:calcium/sodium antiporter [Paracoccaceae bacterium]MCY4196026.1 calcium/sodium antiporter [Paracoccaceae bacterium]